MVFRTILFLLLFPVTTAFPQAGPDRVVPAAERTGLYFPLMQGKRIGLVANSASRAGRQDLAGFLAGKGVQVSVIFSPEHGYYLSAEAGAEIGNFRDTLSGTRVVSLYGAGKKPPAEEMRKLDVILFDLQDVGVRFYTYISTLTRVMEACAENGVPLVVLDRPNPNGYYADG
ncbi:MAG TPA: DUF1343 domain-containing protein, partial [Bacteroidales bacterium]|nr:DUF1343 domain-containing protein [Bacteroidales bacterium]